MIFDNLNYFKFKLLYLAKNSEKGGRILKKFPDLFQTPIFPEFTVFGAPM